MTQISKYQISKEVYNEIFQTFLQTIAGLGTKTSAELFISEFFTPTEKVMFSKRLAIGMLIAEGYDYHEISNLLKISTSTISKYAAFYKYGDGYRKVISKVKNEKHIRAFLLDLGDIISAFGSFGGKGSGTWRNINKDIKSKKSKILR